MSLLDDFEAVRAQFLRDPSMDLGERLIRLGERLGKFRWTTATDFTKSGRFRQTTFKFPGDYGGRIFSSEERMKANLIVCLLGCSDPRDLDLLSSMLLSICLDKELSPQMTEVMRQTIAANGGPSEAVTQWLKRL